MCHYRAEHEYDFYVQHHEPSSLVIAGVGFELVAMLGVKREGRGKANEDVRGSFSQEADGSALCKDVSSRLIRI